MAVLHCDFFSEALSLSTSMMVILPEPTRTQEVPAGPGPGPSPPVLYLLHGISDDHTTWLRRTLRTFGNVSKGVVKVVRRPPARTGSPGR